MAADRRTEELRLHARLIDEILRRASAQHDCGRPGPADNKVGRLDDVADDIDVSRPRPLVAPLRQAHAD